MEQIEIPDVFFIKLYHPLLFTLTVYETWVYGNLTFGAVALLVLILYEIERLKNANKS